MAEALSRISNQSEATFFTLSLPNFVVLDQLETTLHACPEFGELMTQIQQYPTTHSDYTIHRDLIFYKGKIWLNSNNPFTATLFEEYHKTPLGGHIGITKTLHRLQAYFFWKTICQHVQQYVAHCTTCQQMKYETK